MQKAHTLVGNGKSSRLRGIDGLNDCIQNLSEAILIMEDILDESNLVYRQLCEAYCLRALCRQEATPNSEKIFKDVKNALELWLKNKDRFEEKEVDNTIIILYNILDLSQVKGFIELFNDIFYLVKKFFALKKVKLKELLTSLWQSRRLSHALCVSQIDEAFIKSNRYSKIKFWINALKGNSSAITGFAQNLFFLHDDDINFPIDITHDEVCKIANEVVCTSTDVAATTSYSKFVAGYLYYDLSKRLLANGHMLEALSQATEAFHLFEYLFCETFELNFEEDNSFEVKITTIKQVFCLDCNWSDFKDSGYLSPWKVAQCFLEGHLQLGIIYEIAGHASVAEYYLARGKKTSELFDFPLFTVAFSSLLGNLYIKKGNSTAKAKLELLYAQEIINDERRKTFCCLKCKFMLEIDLYKYFGDLDQIPIAPDKVEFSTEAAKDGYMRALKVVNNSDWKNQLSCLEDDSTDASTEDIKCWHCLPSSEVMKSRSLNHIINLKWEFVRRQLSIGLLTRIVKCFGYMDQRDEAHKFLLKGISVLVGWNPFRHTFTSISKDCFHHLVAMEIPGDVFAIQRAEIIYDICWFSMKYYGFEFMRKLFCNLSAVKFEDLASWLTVAFVLSREIPEVFQKVSKLLAVMYVVSSSSGEVSLSTFTKNVGENYWSLYFHQASVGSHFTATFHGKFEAQCDTGSSSTGEESCNSLGFVPKATIDLEKHVKKHLVGLPTATIITLSLLGPEYTTLLQELPLPYSFHTSVQAWMIVSRLSFEAEPLVMLLPLDYISQDEGDLSKYEKSGGDWDCPWGCFTVVDDLIPTFRTILEENCLEREPMKKLDVDKRFGELLRNLEDFWFGSLKYVLRGEWLDCKKLDSMLKNLVKDLRLNCNLDVNEGLLKIILGGSNSDCEGKALVSQLCSRKDCYIAKVGYVDEALGGILLNAVDKRAFKTASKLLKKAINKWEKDDSVKRKPVILVLDYEVQMLPWENLPITRKEEVYRMPSVSSIFAVLDKWGNHKQRVERNLVPFPSIDPQDAFYLINPDCDFQYLDTIENVCKNRNIKGWACCVPHLEDLLHELENRDLFLYFGHGCGRQYIDLQAVEGLEKCSAVLLAGCSSGAITLNGSYAPDCTPLSYLLGGSPAVVANLWQMFDDEMELFGVALFKSLLKARSEPCIECDSQEFEAKGRAKRKVPPGELTESNSLNNSCSHRRRIAAFIPKAREACQLPSLFGANAVCYGVPTTICRKKNIQSHHKHRKSHR